MISFLDLLGTVGGAVLGIPGIVGVALGMATRKWPLALAMGGILGLLGPLMFGGSHASHVTIAEFVISALVGIVAAGVGCAIRHKGATV